jgi:hypothetical protein
MKSQEDEIMLTNYTTTWYALSREYAFLGSSKALAFLGGPESKQACAEKVHGGNDGCGFE